MNVAFRIPNRLFQLFRATDCYWFKIILKFLHILQTFLIQANRKFSLSLKNQQTFKKYRKFVIFSSSSTKDKASRFHVSGRLHLIKNSKLGRLPWFFCKKYTPMKNSKTKRLWNITSLMNIPWWQQYFKFYSISHFQKQ